MTDTHQDTTTATVQNGYYIANDTQGNNLTHRKDGVMGIACGNETMEIVRKKVDALVPVLREQLDPILPARPMTASTTTDVLNSIFNGVHDMTHGVTVTHDVGNGPLSAICAAGKKSGALVAFK